MFVNCQDCDNVHPANFSHMSQWDPTTRVYAVVCEVDWLTSYYTDEVVFARMGGNR